MKISKSYLILIFLLFSSYLIYGATIKGKVTDSVTGNPLIGANVILNGSSLGAATNLEGEYVIYNVPPGDHVLRFSYIGYIILNESINIPSDNQTLLLDVEMELTTLEGEEITVTAQAEGQLSAINQQLSADAMMNIVDAERIQELPDQYVAESIARLPGITVSRNDGEGSGIGIRGLAPQYNQVQIDGVVMSSSANMGRATDFEYNHGRSVSLSNITSENLSGIEVYKAILPDMDAATLGGTVNLRLGRAPDVNQYEVRAFGAYNGYREKWNNYKFMVKTTQRFFDNTFGVQLLVNAEERNRGNDRLSGGISREDPFVDGVRITQYRTTGASIRNFRVQRQKLAVDAIFDYVTPGTELLFSNFYNRGGLTQREIRRNDDNLYGYRTDSESYALSNALRGTHNISNFEIEWQISQFRTETETPDDYGMRWAMQGEDASELNAADKIEITPEEYLALLPDDGIWRFQITEKDVGRISETKYAGKLDIKYPFFFNKISGF
ncbi:MAG: carboxypeptidase-like regulatory domain-containing protein, partial [Melioribacteraceae bacterium]|nr:carboxypeptidase-like regulatory domain-containing protein [Melioribacteraceae bacterium]